MTSLAELELAFDSLAESEKKRLLNTPVRDLGLTIQGTRLACLVESIYRNFEQQGLTFQPRIYLSDDWGCPDTVPLIGMPFYLADEQLTRIEDELMGGVEAESDEDILRYLRHEAGHAFNYAYKLFERPEWQRLFGQFHTPYLEEYMPQPFSRRFVRNIAGWYAQKHPDEDFAETFAIWLTPKSKWEERYSTWECFEKLLYIDSLMKEIGSTPPLVTDESYDFSAELAFTLREYYEEHRKPSIEIPAYLDTDLKDMFADRPLPDTYNMPADHFLGQHRRKLTHDLIYWTGLHELHVRSLVRHLIDRCRALHLFIDLSKSSDTLTRLGVFTTTLCMNKLYRGEFVSN